MKILSLLMMSAMLCCFSCSTTRHFISTPDGKLIDQRLVGKWAGSEDDNQMIGMTKEWIMTRMEDGKFVLDFKATLRGESQEFTETGEWWIENEVFYEFHEVSGKTDTYNYFVISADQIKFKAVSMGIEFENDEYEFIDTRVKDKVK